jgi:uncharacterized iron-regulated protein
MTMFFSINLFANNSIITKNDGQTVDLNKIASDQSNVYFFGEFHDNSFLHQKEIDFLKALYKKNKNIAISMEMFERDVQDKLNEYLAGKIKEKDFLKETRAWPNYKTDYKPIIEFAKKHNLPVIAANIPRRYAAMMRKKGVKAIETLPKNERKFIARKYAFKDDQYRKEFFKVMNSNMGNKMPKQLKNKIFQKYYTAQCLKDETMAESIAQFIKKHPKTVIIHYNGDFHSRYHLGTVQKLQDRIKDRKITVISPVITNNKDEIKYYPQLSDIGDYLIIFYKPAPKNNKETSGKMFKQK